MSQSVSLIKACKAYCAAKKQEMCYYNPGNPRARSLSVIYTKYENFDKSIIFLDAVFVGGGLVQKCFVGQTFLLFINLERVGIGRYAVLIWVVTINKHKVELKKLKCLSVQDPVKGLQTWEGIKGTILRSFI